MRNFLVIFLLLAAISLLTDLFAEEQFSLPAEALEKSRFGLIEQLFELNLPAVCADEDRLTDLGAGYDRDNRQYFIERPARFESFSDSSYLIIIGFSDAGSSLITVFAPQEACYQWLQMRARICNGRVVGRPVFQPDGCVGDLLDFGAACPSRRFFQASLAADN